MLIENCEWAATKLLLLCSLINRKKRVKNCAQKIENVEIFTPHMFVLNFEHLTNLSFPLISVLYRNKQKMREILNLHLVADRYSADKIRSSQNQVCVTKKAE